jgi:hypothetical protein
MKSEPLLKANFKQLKQMFPNTNEHDHVLKWASDIKNNDLQSFYLRHYRNNPSIHTDAMKEKIGHINGMIDISDEMKKVKLSKEDTLESGLQKYEDAEKKWQTGNGSRFVTPSATTKPVIDFGDGWGWFDLGVPADRDEGNALGHCGNAGSPHENDRILSLRKVHNIGGKIYHEPALTFINNQCWIGEMKGRNNSKPSEKYHSRISELLKHKDIKGLVGAGYMPENNFHFDDLSSEHKNQVKMTNPEFVDLRSNEWDIDHKTNFAKKAPKIEKYENTIRDTFKAHNLKTDLDSGKFTMDDIQPEDLRLVANHPHFERKNFDRLVENVHRFQHENQLHAYGTIKNSRHLTSDDLHTLLDNNLSSVDILKDHRLIDLSHINKVVFKNPRLAARVLNNHRLLNSQHIDKIIGKNPGIAAELLKNHKEFNSSHIDKIIENFPRAAAVYLRNHPEFNSSHIDKIVEKDPGEAITWLSDHKEFNSSHIDKIIENSPLAAAIYLRNHPEFNSSHIDKIVEKEPETAAEHLKDHPIYKAKYGNMQKSFKQLTSEYEELQKVIFRNGTHYPESTDRVGTPHPELQHLVVHKARNGKHVWSYHPELSRIHDRNLLQLMGGQKIAGRNNVTLPNRLSSLQKPTASAVKNFAADLLNNPDRHAMSANTDPTKPSHHAEMRVRHLINALTGSEGYEIKDHPEGFEVYAPRHSKSSKADDIATRWIYNISKKDLRSERIYPTSPDGGGYGTKFGKSSFDGRRVDSDGARPRPSSTTGGGRSNERVYAAQRPSSYADALGKNEALGTESIRFSKAAISDELRKAIGRDGNRRLGKTDRGSGANEIEQSKPSYHDVDKSLSMGEKTKEDVLNNHEFKKSVTRGTGSALPAGGGLRNGNERAAQSASLEKSVSEIAGSDRNKMGRSIFDKTQEQLKKAEDEAGMTAYPLKDGYSLHHETTSNGYDIWSIGHRGQRAGSFMICTDDTRRGRPFVSWAGVDKPHRGKGVGAAVYKTLAVHYGGLDSDRGSTSVDALKAWHRAGGKQLKSKTQFGDYRYTLKGDKKRPPIVWNEDLIKSFKSQWGGTLPDTDNSHVERNEWWHGTPSGRFPLNNIHVGSKRAAHEALTATIGHPVEGEWDGTREYGKTLLAGKKTLEAREIPITGYSVDAPFEDHYPTGKAKYSDGTQVSSSEKPNMLRFKIKGKMTSHPHTPRTDMAANAIMKRKGIKQGIYYVNEGEDPGSISAVVPSVEHLEQVINKKKNEDLEKTRGTLTFPKVLPKDTRPEENIKQIPKDEKAHPMYGGLYEVKPAQEQYLHTASKGVPKTHRHLAIAQLKNAMKTGLGVYLPKEDKGFAFVPDYATKAHEAIHAMVAKTAKHFDVHPDEVYHRMNSLIHQDDVPVLKHMLKTFGYPEQSHHEEMIPFVHSILHHQGARNQYLESLKLYHNNVDEEKGRKAIQRLGRTWNAILQTGKKVSQLSDLPKEG